MSYFDIKTKGRYQKGMGRSMQINGFSGEGGGSLCVNQPRLGFFCDLEPKLAFVSDIVILYQGNKIVMKKAW